jgi:hypothetical protein
MYKEDDIDNSINTNSKRNSIVKRLVTKYYQVEKHGKFDPSSQKQNAANESTTKE